MSNIDFIFGIVIVIAVISFSIFYVTDDFSTQLDQMNILELKQASNVLENKIFLIVGEDMNIIRARFEETSGEAHTENINILFTGDVSYAKMYGLDGDYITEGTNQLSFTLNMPADAVVYYNIFYSGSASDITVNGDVDISSRLLKEQDYPVFTEQCNIDYDLLRQELGHSFKIKLGSCEIGPDPPEATVVARTFPVRSKSNPLGEMMTIMVW